MGQSRATGESVIHFSTNRGYEPMNGLLAALVVGSRRQTNGG
jgi:hypothetical protein